MTRKPKNILTLEEQLRRAREAGLLQYKKKKNDSDGLCSLQDRIDRVLGEIIKREQYNNMLFFVMYDIENNKVRRYVVKYLQRCGCSRVQKSVFLANLPYETYSKIKSDLVEVQSYYENSDSILVAPIPSDYLKSMSIIGHNINLDLILRTRSTIFI